MFFINSLQETLTSGTAGLELHFEASQAYKDIVEQASHSDPSLCAQILQGIVQNLDAQDSSKCFSMSRIKNSFYSPIDELHYYSLLCSCVFGVVGNVTRHYNASSVAFGAHYSNHNFKCHLL